MKRRFYFWALLAIFLSSLFFASYCVYQIYLSQNQVEASLNEWEEQKDLSHQVASTPSIGNEEPITAAVASTEFNNEVAQPLYSTPPEKGEVFGKIIIPKIKKEFPLIQGSDQEELAKGVGHYFGSVLPGEPDNTVLAGHRDTVFKELAKVGVGDLVTIETKAGTFTYQISEQRIVDKNDRTVIVPYDYAAMTLITCYPFDFVGPAPDRYILVGKLVEN
ncbi:class D sortase [Bacillus sp. FJAT-29814]|uniref:class D sortase n=1 Tax=Bacillus sp. FJAT-29814 TaxID=1729688 RepID=UPI0008347291|nr:class D sortase [Bacillus sp. FJAT-29814]